MQILCTHCKSIFYSHILNLAYFIKFSISTNYIPFVQIMSPQKFSFHISLFLSLSQFYLQIQSNIFTHVFCPLCFSISSQNVQSSILRVLNLLCFDVRKLLSHPSPLTHFSIVFFSLFSFSYHHIPYALLNPLLSSIRTISPPSSACSLLVLFVLFHVPPPLTHPVRVDQKPNGN